MKNSKEAEGQFSVAEMFSQLNTVIQVIREVVPTEYHEATVARLDAGQRLPPRRQFTQCGPDRGRDGRGRLQIGRRSAPKRTSRTVRAAILRMDTVAPSDSLAKNELQSRPITLRNANDYVELHHRHNSRTVRNGGRFATSVVDGRGNLLGVAIVGNPLSADFMDGMTAEVLRVCTTPDSPKNVCSMLYAACWRAWRAMGGDRIGPPTPCRASQASV